MGNKANMESVLFKMCLYVMKFKKKHKSDIALTCTLQFWTSCVTLSFKKQAHKGANQKRADRLGGSSRSALT